MGIDQDEPGQGLDPALSGALFFGFAAANFFENAARRFPEGSVEHIIFLDRAHLIRNSLPIANVLSESTENIP